MWRDLSLFNLAIDSKLRACDLVNLRVDEVCLGGRVRDRATVVQKKTGRPVQFEITEQTRTSFRFLVAITPDDPLSIRLPEQTSCPPSPIHPTILPASASLG